MKNCDEILPLLGAWVDRSLPPSEEKAVTAHLAGCKRCQAWVDRRRRLSGLLKSALDVPDPGDEYFQTARERLLTSAGVQPSRPARLGRFVPIAALLAASFLIVILGPRFFGRSRAPEIPGKPVEVAKAPAAPEHESPPATPPRKEPPQPPVPPVEPPPAPPLVQEPKPTPPKAVPPVSPSIPRPPSGPPPGTADRLVRMTKEAVDVALAETPAERVTALCAAAEAQLEELRRMLAKDPELAAELAAAYRILVSDGVSSVLRDPSEPAEELAAAREIASRRARGHEATLLALGGDTSGQLKENLTLALEASRELSRR